MYVMGSEQFISDSKRLFCDQLHLGEWHGFNKLSLKEPVEPAAIEYRVRLSRGAYIYFIFNRNASGHYGLRLGRNAQFPSMFYQADRLNKFVSRTALDLTPNRLSVTCARGVFFHQQPARAIDTTNIDAVSRRIPTAWWSGGFAS
jgi:hypothetical protein